MCYLLVLFGFEQWRRDSSARREKIVGQIQGSDLAESDLHDGKAAWAGPTTMVVTVETAPRNSDGPGRNDFSIGLENWWRLRTHPNDSLRVHGL